MIPATQSDDCDHNTEIDAYLYAWEPLKIWLENIDYERSSATKHVAPRYMYNWMRPRTLKSMEIRNIRLRRTDPFKPKFLIFSSCLILVYILVENLCFWIGPSIERYCVRNIHYDIKKPANLVFFWRGGGASASESGNSEHKALIAKLVNISPYVWTHFWCWILSTPPLNFPGV